MVVLALNCGSSSVKFGLFPVGPDAAPDDRRRPVLGRGQVDGLFTGEATVRLGIGEGAEEARVPIEGHEAAVQHVLARLADERAGLPPIAAVGHRVVHGGNRFRHPVLIDRDVIGAIEALEALAPLHNRPSLAGIQAARAALGSGVPMVAVFDTAFHASLPEYASTYAISRELASASAGACVSFEGWVRDHNEGRTVQKLAYQAYAPLATSEGERILAEAAARFAIERAVCVHRTGELAIGDLAVWVGVSAAHRDAAFAACRYVIDEIKLRVPIWKNEFYRDGASGWLHPDGRPVEA